MTLAFPDLPKLWAALVTSKWLAPLASDATTAGIADVKDRAPAPDATLAAFTDHLPEIEALLDAHRIGTVSAGGVFTGPQGIREGWLKLKNAPASPALSSTSNPTQNKP